MPTPRIRRRTLSSVRRDFERWRTRRSRGRHIPDRLWAAAALLAREHGVSKTSSALGLDYYSLKKRAAAAGPIETEPAAEFLEVPVEVLTPALECVVEIEDGAGARLRVEFRGGATREAEAVARALWSASR